MAADQILGFEAAKYNSFMKTLVGSRWDTIYQPQKTPKMVHLPVTIYWPRVIEPGIAQRKYLGMPNHLHFESSSFLLIFTRFKTQNRVNI